MGNTCCSQRGGDEETSDPPIQLTQQPGPSLPEPSSAVSSPNSSIKRKSNRDFTAIGGLYAASLDLTWDTSHIPGIGYELEGGNILLRNENAVDGPINDRQAIKGAVLRPVGMAARSKDSDWYLSAEVKLAFDDARYLCELCVEIIVNGKKAKLGQQRVAQITEEIQTFMREWRPADGHKVIIDGFERYGEWTLGGPKEYLDEVFVLGVQITVSMPLSTIYEYIRRSQDRKKKTHWDWPIIGTLNSKLGAALLILEKDLKSILESRGVRRQEAWGHDVLAFFSLLCSYAARADFVSKEEGPKHLLSIMPRTDLAAIYTRFVKPKVQDAYDRDYGLYDLVQGLCSAKNASVGEKLRWAVRLGGSKPEDSSKVNFFGLTLGEVTIRQLCDGLEKHQTDFIALMDRACRFAQFGGFGSKMELTIAGDVPPVGDKAPRTALVGPLAPIWEFRDIASVNIAQLGKLVEHEGCIIKEQCKATGRS